MTVWKLVIVCVLALAVFGAGCGADDSDDPASTATVTGQPRGPNVLEPLTTGRDILAKDGRYSLRIPGEWVEYDDRVAELAFRTIGEDPALGFNVVREEIDGNMRVQTYAEKARNTIGTTFRNVMSLSLAPVQVGELDAYRWIYTASVGSTAHLFYQVYIVDGGQGFVLTGSAPITADVDTIRSTFDAIAGSLTFARG